MCYCDVCEGAWHEQPWLATAQCVLTEPELQVASEAAQESSELRRANGKAGGNEGRMTNGERQSTQGIRISTAEGALCAAKNAEGSRSTDKEAEGVGAQSARYRAWSQDRTTTADWQVTPEARLDIVEYETTPEAASSTSELLGVGGDEGRIAHFQGALKVWSSEPRGAGGGVGRSSVAGLHVTPKVLSVGLELQGAGSDERRCNTTGLQA
jgi:hypothetical protein